MTTPTKFPLKMLVEAYTAYSALSDEAGAETEADESEQGKRPRRRAPQSELNVRRVLLKAGLADIPRPCGATRRRCMFETFFAAFEAMSFDQAVRPTPDKHLVWVLRALAVRGMALSLVGPSLGREVPEVLFRAACEMLEREGAVRKKYYMPAVYQAVESAHARASARLGRQALLFAEVYNTLVQDEYLCVPFEIALVPPSGEPSRAGLCLPTPTLRVLRFRRRQRRASVLVVPNEMPNEHPDVQAALEVEPPEPIVPPSPSACAQALVEAFLANERGSDA